MNLAKILVLSICWVAWALPVRSTNQPQPAETDSAATGTGNAQQGTPDSQTPAEDKPSAASQPAARGKTAPANAPVRARRKKKKATGCAAIGQTSPSGNAASTASSSSVGASSGQSGANPAAPTDCPPPKIVVHQGGAPEPSIQLAGGPGQTSQARTTASPMLEATEANLKKLEARQLSDAEKDMVTQIRQFMEQSKTAVTAGDVERARTLAWKAQTLSEDLLRPAK